MQKNITKVMLLDVTFLIMSTNLNQNQRQLPSVINYIIPSFDTILLHVNKIIGRGNVR